ncbi:recombinase family protein [Corynebacterium tuberculostearicum]|uniref:recombinase family protein n=1 Tax=Corynebacterium tuberculostearicum TaxID=38304 RepID=UPI002934602E|nr:recombinase family protein [Corynebacterium tuberculostearicum]MDV2421507.1 recombinase family protein [Corynebacterium tuberculostearicum]
MAKSSGSRGQRVGYIRVSTVEQNNQRQKELLNASGRIDRFFEDKISGRTKTARPGLRECMAYVRDGDELVVSSIDRLARSLTDLRGIVDELTGKGVTVTFLHENLIFAKGTTDPRADLMLGILGSFAEFERAIIRERQAEGIALAKKAGKYKGRKPALTPALTPDQVAEIKRRTLAGESKAALAREFGVTRPTVYRALKNA